VGTSPEDREIHLGAALPKNSHLFFPRRKSRLLSLRRKVQLVSEAALRETVE